MAILGPRQCAHFTLAGAEELFPVLRVLPVPGLALPELPWQRTKFLAGRVETPAAFVRGNDRQPLFAACGKGGAG